MLLKKLMIANYYPVIIGSSLWLSLVLSGRSQKFLAKTFCCSSCQHRPGPATSHYARGEPVFFWGEIFQIQDGLMTQTNQFTEVFWLRHTRSHRSCFQRGVKRSLSPRSFSHVVHLIHGPKGTRMTLVASWCSWSWTRWEDEELLFGNQ